MLVFVINENEYSTDTVQLNHEDSFVTVNFDEGYVNYINHKRKDWTSRYDSDTDSTTKPYFSKVEKNSGALFISNIKSEVNEKLHNHFVNKSFMLRETQSFKRRVLDTSVSKEEEMNLKNVKLIFVLIFYQMQMW